MSIVRALPSRRRSLARTALVSVAAAVGVAVAPVPAFASAPAPTAVLVAAPVAATPAAQVAVDVALAQLGKAYQWGAAGPGTFDCSGLTQYAYAAAGIALPHSSWMQATIGTPVAEADLQPGDLVFFYQPIGHVGIYLGNGQIVHAPTTGDVVKVTDLRWMYGYTTARRLG